MAETKNLTKEDLKLNHCYSAKIERVAVDGLINDRQILHIGSSEVQYDSPSVARGRHYPKVTFEKFLKWAKEDITDKMPKGEWRNKYASK